MTSRFGVELHPKDVRWAAAEGVGQDVIAAVLLLHERSVDDIAPQLNATWLEQVIARGKPRPASAQQPSSPSRNKACRIVVALGKRLSDAYKPL
jgi:hypothetical protein